MYYYPYNIYYYPYNIYYYPYITTPIIFITTMQPLRTYVIQQDQHLQNLRRIIKRDFFGSKQPQGLKLNEYLVNFKSNQNQFFSQMVQTNKQQWRDKHWWVGKQDKLMLLSASNPLPISFNGVDHSITKQPALNTVFFAPQSCLSLHQEHTQHKKILYDNCKITQIARYQPITNALIHSYNTNDIPSTPLLEGEVEVEYHGVGNRVYRSVVGAEPQPQVAPILTWGTVQSTPLRLQSYRMPETPVRDELLHTMHHKTKQIKKDFSKRKSQLMTKIIRSIAERSHRNVSSLRRVGDSVQRGEQMELKGLLRINKKQ